MIESTYLLLAFVRNLVNPPPGMSADACAAASRDAVAPLVDCLPQLLARLLHPQQV